MNSYLTMDDTHFIYTSRYADDPVFVETGSYGASIKAKTTFTTGPRTRRVSRALVASIQRYAPDVSIEDILSLMSHAGADDPTFEHCLNHPPTVTIHGGKLKLSLRYEADMGPYWGIGQSKFCDGHDDFIFSHELSQFWKADAVSTRAAIHLDVIRKTADCAAIRPMLNWYSH